MRTEGKRRRAELAAELVVPDRSWACAVPGGGWSVQARDGRMLHVDAHLVVQREFPIPTGWLGAHGIAPSGNVAVVSGREQVSVVDAEGRTRWEVGHPAWGRGNAETGCAAFSADGALVWATVPGADGPDRLWALDARTGEVLGGSQLQCYAAGTQVVRHPDDHWIGFSVGEGQDGSEVYWASWDHGVDLVRLEARDRVLAAVNPDGRSFLATPHDQDRVTIHEFPTGRVSAEVGPEHLGSGEFFDFDGCYLDGDTVAVKVVDANDDSTRTALFDAHHLAPLGSVGYPNPVDRNLLWGGDGRWLTLEWPRSVLALWTLEP